jgi:hypothetical protein
MQKGKRREREREKKLFFFVDGEWEKKFFLLFPNGFLMME